MKTNERLLDTLIESGIDRAFTLPGLGITWSLPAFYDRKDSLDLVLCRSEQVASVMAQVTGRLSGKAGVFLGQGPWVASTGQFGIIEAAFSGTPMLIITDTSDYNGYGLYGCYQSMVGGYGALDIQAVLRPMTKYCAYATEPEDIVYGAQMAYKHANLPRKGPAALIMKTTIIREEFPEKPKTPIYPSAGYYAYTAPKPDAEAVDRLGELLDRAKNPVIVAGNGVFGSGMGSALLDLAQKSGVAIVTSYLGKGSVDESADVVCGMLGTWGHPAASRMVQKADLVIMLGASMGPDYTRFRDPKMIRPGEQTLVQVDVDPRAAGWVYPVDLAITGDVADVVPMLARRGLDGSKKAARMEGIRELKAKTLYDAPGSFTAEPGRVANSDVVKAMQQFMGKDDMITLDAGNSRIWFTNSLRIRHQNQLLAPGGAGGMGWGGPAAAAAKLHCPDKRVTCIAGDGGFMMTADVVATCAQHKIGAVFVIMNNCGLGMVRDNMGSKRIACDFHEVDFAKVGEGMGAKGLTVRNPGDFGDALREAHSHEGGPVVIDVKIDPKDSHKAASDYVELE
ncbi:MAG: thiamine pyrophosphate-binding protein [Desulfovibrio sp.]|uniref:thiamine pyrophosphate-binding protein n=1 Tax=Desulfovibrio sp. TaxID=885 RepID=UPI0039E7228E